jgi:hypothetical protein
MNIVELATQAGMEQDGEMWFSNLYKTDMDVHISHLEAFAKLVAAHEREECAKIAAETVCDVHLPTGTKIYGSRVATTIRARGTT